MKEHDDLQIHPYTQRDTLQTPTPGNVASICSVTISKERDRKLYANSKGYYSQNKLKNGLANCLEGWTVIGPMVGKSSWQCGFLQPYSPFR